MDFTKWTKAHIDENIECLDISLAFLNDIGEAFVRVNQGYVFSRRKKLDCKSGCSFMAFLLKDCSRDSILQDDVSSRKKEVTLDFDEDTNIIILSNLERLLEQFDEEFKRVTLLCSLRIDVLNGDVILSVHHNCSVG